MKTIDITPTWRGILPALLAVYTDGTAKGRADALKELQRMADIADQAVADAKGDAAHLHDRPRDQEQQP